MTPVLEADATDYFAYFPNDKNGTWVSMKSYKNMIKIDESLQGYNVLI